MTILGLGLLVWRYRIKGVEKPSITGEGQLATNEKSSWLQRVLLAVLVVIPLVMPSDWTQDVPERYGGRHEGMKH